MNLGKGDTFKIEELKNINNKIESKSYKNLKSEENSFHSYDNYGTPKINKITSTDLP